MLKIIFRILLLVALTNVSITTYAQEKRTRTKKSIKEFDDKKEERKQAELDAQEAGRKKHIKLQEKEVRKRMKRSAKQAERNRKGKREPFLRRLFRKK